MLDTRFADKMEQALDSGDWSRVDYFVDHAVTFHGLRVAKERKAEKRRLRQRVPDDER